jgi:hypothetical protein
MHPQWGDDSPKLDLSKELTPRIKQFFRKTLMFGHFGDIEGSNKYDVDVLVVIGTLRMRDEDTRLRYEALAAQEATTEDGESAGEVSLEGKFRWKSTEDGLWETFQKTFEHKGLRRVADYLSARTIIQAVGRARHVFGPKSGKEPVVYLLCHHPVAIAGLSRWTAQEFFSVHYWAWAITKFLPALGKGKTVCFWEELRKRFPTLSEKKARAHAKEIVKYVDNNEFKLAKAKKGYRKA